MPRSERDYERLLRQLQFGFVPGLRDVEDHCKLAALGILEACVLSIRMHGGEQVICLAKYSSLRLVVKVTMATILNFVLNRTKYCFKNFDLWASPTRCRVLRSTRWFYLHPTLGFFSATSVLREVDNSTNTTLLLQLDFLFQTSELRAGSFQFRPLQASNFRSQFFQFRL